VFDPYANHSFRPVEIRLSIFEHLIDLEEPLINETFKPAAKPRGNTANKMFQSALNFIIPKPPTLLKSLTLVNSQIRQEFLAVFSQKALFKYTLDATNPDIASFWKTPDTILDCMRTVRLKVLANPGIVSEFDPRQVEGDWELKDRVFAIVDSMTRLEDLRLSIQASGNQLWNPLWLWHYTSQAFKESKVTAFKSMTFHLEGPNMHMHEPNHLERGHHGNWEWRCAQNHFLREDCAGPQNIRKFCSALYAECIVCDPDASGNFTL